MAKQAIVYKRGRVPLPTTFKASPVAFDDKILLASEDGHVFVIKTGPVHEVLAVNKIDEPIWASPAIAHGDAFYSWRQELALQLKPLRKIPST